ncbi:MAG: sugar phosphate isomerase/epimerase [Candidatus Aenigmatarchaeota archaeon]
MNIGIFASRKNSLFDNLRFVVKNNFKWMEFRPSDFKLDSYILKRIREISYTNKINLIIHLSSFNLNLPLSADDLKLIKKELEVAKIVKVKSITLHGGQLSDCYSVEKQLDFLVKNLKTMMSICKNIPLALENSVNGVVRGRREYITLLSYLQELKITLDIGHLILVKESVDKFIKCLHKFICNVHLHDVKGKKDHLPIGSGNINFLKIFRCLKKVGYEGPFIFEFFSKNRLLESKEKMERWYNGL